MKQENNYRTEIDFLIQNAEELHNTFYDVKVFTGPSLYFHKKAIDTIDAEDNERYLEYIYATLVSWGMHRMGPSGAKMLGFDKFKKSIELLKDKIEIAKIIDPTSIAKTDWIILKKIFTNITIMASGTGIVGNSKVMAHLLPHIIPPIDRAYTVNYLGEKIENGSECEWLLMRKIIEKFFIPISNDKNFRSLSKDWLKNKNKYQWDTSPFKIIDNLIIAAVKLQKNEKEDKQTSNHEVLPK